MRLDVSEDARADLGGIRDFGRRRWGLAQARVYSTKLRAEMRALAAGTASGTNAGDVSPGLRRRLCGSHVIFFRTDGDAVRVIRVLGQRQDPGRHLGP